MEEAILAQKESVLHFVSEFEDANRLEPIFKDHPLWPQFKDILETEHPILWKIYPGKIETPIASFICNAEITNPP